MKDNKSFWRNLQKLVDESKIVIDRPKGSKHPKFTETVYKVDYGYLEDTRSADGAKIDVFMGTDGDRKISGVAVTIDLYKRDSEILVLVGCTDSEKEKIQEHLIKFENYQGIIVEKPR
jgi:inorganic pyrophosphatase